MFYKLSAFLFFAFATQATAKDGDRIVGGSKADIQEAPYQVALSYNNKFICGGSLITDKCVLTAAHCVQGVAADKIKVRAGITKLGDVGAHQHVNATFKPSSFNLASMDMDVAILALNGTLSGTNIETIPLANSPLTPGQVIKVTGWGYTQENANDISTVLRKVQLNVIGKKKCAKDYKGQSKLTNSMFCATVAGGKKDACLGDSGGPAVSHGHQVGIVSFGIGCARRNFPGVYTSIQKVRPWIDDIVAKHC